LIRIAHRLALRDLPAALARHVKELGN